jgi:hypothetical protein
VTDIFQIGLHSVENVDFIRNESIVSAENIQADKLEYLTCRLLLCIKHRITDIPLREIHNARCGNEEHQADKKNNLRTYRVI